MPQGIRAVAEDGDLGHGDVKDDVEAAVFFAQASCCVNLIYIYIYIYLEPQWPLFLKVNASKKQALFIPFPTTTRVIWVIWVPGIYLEDQPT